MGYLTSKEISCRVQSISDKGLILLLYITSRDGQKRLDEKYGPMGWKDSYKEINNELFCEISAFDEKTKQWISKEDVGTASYTEKEKSRVSDAFKRCCVKHGIGRELYTAPFIFVPSKVCTIKEKNGKLYTTDSFSVNYISYTADGSIDELEIINQDMDIVFKQYPSGLIDEIKLKALMILMNSAEVPEHQVLELFRITSLKELTIKQFVQLTNKLQKTIESRGES